MNFPGPLSLTEKQIIRSVRRSWCLVDANSRLGYADVKTGIVIGMSAMISATPGNHRPWLPDLWKRYQRWVGCGSD